MVMSSRPTAENPTEKDYRVPSDPGRTGSPGPTEPMTIAGQIDDAGTNIGTNESAASHAARNTGTGPAAPMPGVPSQHQALR